MPDFFTLFHEAFGTLGVVVILGAVAVGILIHPNDGKPFRG